MKKLLSTLFISTALLFVGCEGDEGPQGPAGADGNANVKSETFTVAPSQWQVVQSGQGVTFYLDTNISILTDDIINSGSAHLYFETNVSIHGTDMHWVALPTSYMYYYLSTENGLTVNSGINFPNSQETARFKLVTVAGSLQNVKVDFNNYESVKEHFGLEDF